MAITVDTLVELLCARSRAETTDYIAQKLQTDRASVEEALMTGIRQARIARTQKGRYTTPEQMDLVPCRVRYAASLAFGEPISPSTKEALDGGIRLDMPEESAWPDDVVLVRLTEGAPRARGTVVSIARREKEVLAATLVVPPSEPQKRQHGRAGKRPRKMRFPPEITAVPDDVRIRDRIRIEGDLCGAQNGDVVLVRILQYPHKAEKASGSIQQVIGNAQDTRSVLKAIAASHGFNYHFSEEALAEAETFPRTLSPAEISGRLDLRTVSLFTIDGADAQDFDDAVSLEKTEKGWRLGVHIADVSHYVLPGSDIEKEAFSRTTSLYLPGLTFPMLPEVLSNCLCSLMPREDRLTLSCIMEIQNAEVLSYQIVPSIIRSAARLVYSDVNALFAEKENTVPEQLHQQLFQMRALSRELRVARENRGAIDFDLPEPAFTLADNGDPIQVTARERGDAEKLIEDFMLTANETVARFAREKELPIPYRVHEPPDPDVMESVALYLEAIEIPSHLGGMVAPATIRDILQSVKGKPEEKAVHSTMLRAMRKAEYHSMPHGHFALAARDYCHFTSPIRRYPDLMVHRILKHYLQGEATNEWIAVQAHIMPEIASHCSNGENAAVQAEREGDNRMRARFMARHTGHRFAGTISGLTQTSVFVSLPNTVEGRIPVWTLDQPYTYVEELRCLMGDYDHALLRVGTPVEVRVDSVEERSGYVEFRLLRLPEGDIG